MILLFARVLGWFPSSGFADPAVGLLPALSHAFLPSLALGLGLMAHLTRMTRSTMTGILGQEFIRVGRAKDAVRIVQFLDARMLNVGRLCEILDRHHMADAWRAFCRRTGVADPCELQSGR